MALRGFYFIITNKSSNVSLHKVLSAPSIHAHALRDFVTSIDHWTFIYHCLVAVWLQKKVYLLLSESKPSSGHKFNCWKIVWFTKLVDSLCRTTHFIFLKIMLGSFHLLLINCKELVFLSAEFAIIYSSKAALHCQGSKNLLFTPWSGFFQEI